MDDFDDFGSGLINKPRRNTGATLAGAALGIVLAGFLAFGGFKAFLLAIIFAAVGGAIGRFWVAEG